MKKQRTRSSNGPEGVLGTLRELRMLLNEMNAKLDHLIERCRRFYFTDDISDSSLSEFRR